MKFTKFGTIFALSLLATASGCQETDFFYHDPPNAAAEHLNFRSRIVDQSGFSSVDIIWVIDNSGSMSTYQNAVITNTALFMSRFRPGISWKMGLISTDFEEQPYVGFTPSTELNSRTANPDAVFAAAVGRLGTSGDGTEKAFHPLLNTLRGFPGFLTPGGALAIIVVTDAPEQSGGNYLDDLLQHLRATRGNLDSVFTYGVFGARDLGCNNPAEDTWDYATNPYKTFFDQTHGRTFPICSPDFGSNLAGLADDLFARVMTPQVFLPKRPVIDTLRVFYQGVELPGGPSASGGRWYYDYSLNSIVFYDLSFANGALEDVDVQYVEDIGTIVPPV